MCGQITRRRRLRHRRCTGEGPSHGTHRSRRPLRSGPRRPWTRRRDLGCSHQWKPSAWNHERTKRMRNVRVCTMILSSGYRSDQNGPVAEPIQRTSTSNRVIRGHDVIGPWRPSRLVRTLLSPDIPRILHKDERTITHGHQRISYFARMAGRAPARRIGDSLWVGCPRRNRIHQ